MRQVLVLATVLALPALLSGQASTLRVTIVLPDEAQQPTPVSRHVLLISANPATTIPKRVLTGPDGSVSIPLIPGSYTVESDRPAIFAGKSYAWTQMIDVVAGSTVALALTADNAEVTVAPEVTTPADAGTPRSDPSFLPAKWLGSVMAIWSPTTRTTGFLFDARGLIATRGLGAAKGTTVAINPRASNRNPVVRVVGDHTAMTLPSHLAGRNDGSLLGVPGSAGVATSGAMVTSALFAVSASVTILPATTSIICVHAYDLPARMAGRSDSTV